ncbi:MAG: ABC transporter transmembrane domain-containing protein [Elusimicrobiota bacterium]
MKRTVATILSCAVLCFCSGTEPCVLLAQTLRQEVPVVTPVLTAGMQIPFKMTPGLAPLSIPMTATLLPDPLPHTQDILPKEAKTAPLRLPGESRGPAVLKTLLAPGVLRNDGDVVAPAKAGVQQLLDSGLRRNDEMADPGLHRNNGQDALCKDHVPTADELNALFDGTGVNPPAGDFDELHSRSEMTLALQGTLGRVILADPSEDKQPPPPPPSRWSQIKTNLRAMLLGEPEMSPLLAPYRTRMNIARMLLIVKAGLSTAQSYVVGALVDAAIAHALPGVGLWLAVAAALILLKAVDEKIYTSLSGIMRAQIREDVRLRLFDNLLERSKAAAGPKDDPKELASRLTSDVGRIAVRNVAIPIQFPQHLIQLSLATGFVLCTSWKLAAVVFTVIPILLAISLNYSRRSSAMQAIVTAQQAALTRVAAENLGKEPQAGDLASQRYREAVQQLESSMKALVRLDTSFELTREILQSFFSDILVLGVGLLSFLYLGVPSVGQVMALRGYAKDMRGAVDGFIDLYVASNDAASASSRLRELLIETSAATPGKSTGTIAHP